MTNCKSEKLRAGVRTRNNAGRYTADTLRCHLLNNRHPPNCLTFIAVTTKSLQWASLYFRAFCLGIPSGHFPDSFLIHKLYIFLVSLVRPGHLDIFAFTVL